VTVGDYATIVATGGLRYGGSSISGGRSLKRNTLVGGHPDSFHMLWLANDLVFDTTDGMDRAEKFYRRMGLHTKRNGVRTLHIQVVSPEIQT